MKRFKGTKGMLCLLAIILILASYFVLSNHKSSMKSAEYDVTVSNAQNLLLRDLDKNYPPTVKEVLKYYLEITKCLHNEKITEDETEALALKILELYDAELVQNKPQEAYLADLKSEIIIFRDNDYAISSYALPASTAVDYFSQDGYSFARIYCTYYIRVKTSMQNLDEVFLLREDDTGRWKIYGWQQVKEEDTKANENE